MTQKRENREKITGNIFLSFPVESGGWLAGQHISFYISKENGTSDSNFISVFNSGGDQPIPRCIQCSWPTDMNSGDCDRFRRGILLHFLLNLRPTPAPNSASQAQVCSN